MSELDEFLKKEFDRQYWICFDHLFMCGDTVEWKHCPKLSEHEAEAAKYAEHKKGLEHG